MSSKYDDAVIAKALCDGVSKLTPDLLIEILSKFFADNGFLNKYFDQILKSACSKFDKHTENKFPKNYTILERMKDYGWVHRAEVSKVPKLFVCSYDETLSTSAEGHRTTHGEISDPRK